MALYREDFEQAACDCPACRETSRTSEMYFHPRCHPESPTWVRYRGDVLTVECAKCSQEVVTVVIASRASEPPKPGPADEEACP